MGNLPDDMGHDEFLRDQAEEEQRRLLEAEAKPVVDALGDGVLGELVRYLKADGPDLPGLPEGTVAIPLWLTDELVNMIEGDHWFRLGVTSMKRGQKRLDYLRGRVERFRVGCFVEARIRQLGRGGYESAVEDALKRYMTPGGGTHHRSYVTKAHGEVRKYIKEMETAGSDGWRFLTKLYGPTVSG